MWSARIWNSICRAPFDQLLQVDIAIAKGASASRRADCQQAGHLVQAAHLPHALAAAAGRGLDQQRENRSSARSPEVRRRTASLASVPGTTGTPALDHCVARRLLCRPSAQSADGFGPMKTMPSSCAGLGKILALGQEAIARVDGICAALFAISMILIRPQIDSRGAPGRADRLRRHSGHAALCGLPPRRRRRTRCPVPGRRG